MKLTRVLVMAGLLLASALQLQCTLGRGLSTPEERAKAIEIARSLERDPLATSAPTNRQWLLNWIIEIPDIRFKICLGLLSPGVGDEYRYSTEVNQQIIFSAAAFKLEHPDHLRNDMGSYFAGVEGALRVYEVLVSSAPDARLDFLDGLLAKRDRGELADHVAQLANKNCKRSKTALILNLAGAGVAILLGLLAAPWFDRRRTPPATAAETVTHDANSSKVPTMMRRVALLCATYFVIALSILHILEPEFDPRFRFMSEYALGDYGWFMSTAFVALGMAPFVTAIGLRYVHNAPRSARIGLGILTVAAVFIWLAGIFRDSIPHLLAGVVAFPSMVMSVLLLSWTFRRAAGWQSIHRVGLFIGLIMLAMLILMEADVGMPGLQQRVCIFSFLLWLSIVAHRMAQVSAERPASR